MYITTPDQAQEIALQKQTIKTQKYYLLQLLDRRIQAVDARSPLVARYKRSPLIFAVVEIEIVCIGSIKSRWRLSSIALSTKNIRLIKPICQPIYRSEFSPRSEKI